MRKGRGSVNLGGADNVNTKEYFTLRKTTVKMGTPLILAVRETEQIRGQPDVQSDFRDSQNYAQKPCLKKQTKREGRKLGVVIHILDPNTLDGKDKWIDISLRSVNLCLAWSTQQIPDI